MEQQLTGKSILFASVPADGHVNPLTGLAKYLQSIGCDVRWYTSEIYADKMEDLEIPFYPFDRAVDINSGNVAEVLPERALIADAVEKLDYDMLHIFAKRGSEYLEDIQAIYQSFPFDLMIADSLFPAIPLVRGKMKIPVIAVGVMPLATNSVDLAPYGMALPPAMNPKEKAEYAELHDRVNNVMFKQSIDYFSEVLTSFGIAHKKTILLDQLIVQADLHLQIGTPGFEYERSDFGDNIRFIGGLMPYKSTKKASPWYNERLKKYKKILLVTQGTVERDTKKLLEPTLAAFRNTDTLVIATTGGFDTARLGILYAADNIIIEDFIPFDQVMPYADVYITNGGYGGTMLSIKNKLPMVAAGVHEGKSEVCARIGFFNCGINLRTETPTVEALHNAVEEVLSNKLYKENVTRLSEEIERVDSNELCANFISQLLFEEVKY
ncbi:glycosyltransferase [Mucilaginibacter sp. McL0603]|uniref:glycosyltransferase n=1 Tax=Mucilaginibacter sp. McL0603 TaxID=3415670 RepID=UPI003CF50067